jgi:hypothetical protein
MRKAATAAAALATLTAAGCAASAPAATRYISTGQACAGVYINFEYQQPRIEQLANDPHVDPGLRAVFRTFVLVMVTDESTSTPEQRNTAFNSVDRACNGSRSQANW